MGGTFLARKEGLRQATHKLVAPTTGARLESLQGVEGLFYDGVTVKIQWRFAARLAASQSACTQEVLPGPEC